jgi:uncharacterized membrane protein
MSVTDPNPAPPPQPIVSNSQLALVVYILYLVSYAVGGITALVGVIIAHIQVDQADPVQQSHYRFQIRTFWIGLIYLIVGCLLAIVLIGFLVLMWWFIWTLVRNIKGLLALNENRPIADPTSWMFG